MRAFPVEPNARFACDAIAGRHQAAAAVMTGAVVFTVRDRMSGISSEIGLRSG